VLEIESNGFTWLEDEGGFQGGMIVPPWLQFCIIIELYMYHGIFINIFKFQKLIFMLPPELTKIAKYLFDE
jgi:hypothetical protein